MAFSPHSATFGCASLYGTTAARATVGCICSGGLNPVTVGWSVNVAVGRRGDGTLGVRARLLFSHGLTLVVGSVFLWWLAGPLAPADWDSLPAVHWAWLVVPCAVLAMVAGACQGTAVGLDRFWPTLLALFPAGLAAL
jgi:hypothetical protein